MAGVLLMATQLQKNHTVKSNSSD